MTTVAAPARRASPTRRRPTPSTRPLASAAPRLRVGRVGALLALFTVFALVSAVVFHVLLAQNQLELDRLNAEISTEQRTYEQRRLTTSLLASPQRIIQEAERLGLVVPPEPAQYLYVPDAPMPAAADGSSTTIADWSKTKSNLDPREP